MEYPFKSPGIGYPVVEFTRNIVSLHASSVVVRGSAHISRPFLSIQSCQSCSVLDRLRCPFKSRMLHNYPLRAPTFSAEKSSLIETGKDHRIPYLASERGRQRQKEPHATFKSSKRRDELAASDPHNGRRSWR